MVRQIRLASLDGRQIIWAVIGDESMTREYKWMLWLEAFQLLSRYIAEDAALLEVTFFRRRLLDMVQLSRRHLGPQKPRGGQDAAPSSS